MGDYDDDGDGKDAVHLEVVSEGLKDMDALCNVALVLDDPLELDMVCRLELAPASKRKKISHFIHACKRKCLRKSF